MCNLSEVTDAVLNGSDEYVQHACRLLYGCPRLRKGASLAYLRFESRLRHIGWEDLFHEAVIEVIKEIQQGRGPRSNLHGYFFRLCLNKCQGFLRKEPPTPFQHTAVDVIEVVVHYANNEQQKDLHAVMVEAMDELKTQCRLLMWHYYMEEPPVKNYDQLAHIVNEQKHPGEKGLSPDSVPQTLTRCREKLKLILQQKREALYDLLNI